MVRLVSNVTTKKDNYKTSSKDQKTVLEEDSSPKFDFEADLTYDVKVLSNLNRMPNYLHDRNESIEAKMEKKKKQIKD